LIKINTPQKYIKKEYGFKQKFESVSFTMILKFESE